MIRIFCYFFARTSVSHGSAPASGLACLQCSFPVTQLVCRAISYERRGVETQFRMLGYRFSSVNHYESVVLLNFIKHFNFGQIIFVLRLEIKYKETLRITNKHRCHVVEVGAVKASDFKSNVSKMSKRVKKFQYFQNIEQ